MGVDVHTITRTMSGVCTHFSPKSLRSYLERQRKKTHRTLAVPRTSSYGSLKRERDRQMSDSLHITGWSLKEAFSNPLSVLFFAAPQQVPTYLPGLLQSLDELASRQMLSGSQPEKVCTCRINIATDTFQQSCLNGNNYNKFGGVGKFEDFGTPRRCKQGFRIVSPK